MTGGELMTKSKRSILNANAALALSICNGILGLFTTKLVIETYGSDFNGLNSTANQFVNILMLLEGGFALATNVALFKPFSKNDYITMNKIIVATKNKFQKIGALFFLLGLIGAFTYSFIINSNLSRSFVFAVIIMAVLPSAFNLFFATKYRILIQADQKEYVISLITLFTISISYIINIIIAYLNAPMILIRVTTMIFLFLQSFLISLYCKRNYKFINFNEKPNYTLIKGTKDVFIQKMTGVIYSTFPILIISISPAGGTKLASVYAVYNSVFFLLKSFIQSVMDAPRLSFGQLIIEKNRSYVFKKFVQYELIVIIILSSVLSTASVLILPFVEIYTINITDINYLDKKIAVMMILITFFEILHIPSGNILNMSGLFNISKNIQLFSVCILIITMSSGAYFYGIYGILSSVLLTAIVIAILEIYYIHKKYFENIKIFFKLLIPNFFIIIVLVIIEFALISTINNFINFVIIAGLLFFINTLIVCLLNYLINKYILKDIINTLINMVRKK